MRRRPMLPDAVTMPHATARAWQRCGLHALRQMRLARAHGHRLGAANATRFYQRQWCPHACQLPMCVQHALTMHMRQWLNVQSR